MNIKIINCILYIGMMGLSLHANASSVEKKLETAICFSIRESAEPLRFDGLIKRNTPEALKQPIEIAIIGCVARPGLYYVEAGFNAADLAALAGGYTETAMRSRASLVSRGMGEKWYFENIISSGPPAKTLSRWALRDGDSFHIPERI